MNNWKEYLKKPKNLKLYIIHTGDVHMAGNIHYNRKSPKFKSMPKDNRFNPVFAYLVEHPGRGMLLLDTGIHPSFTEMATGNFGWLLGRIVKIKTSRGMDLLSQMMKIDVSADDIKNVVLSHLHLDHPSGLPSLRGNKGITVFVDKDELEAASSPFALFEGYIRSHYKGFNIEEMRYKLTIPPFDMVCDLFDDESIFIIRTPGHTPGHVSVILNASGGPVFLTFDAAHRSSNIEEGIPPKGDYEEALKSINNIKAFLDAFPKTRVIFGHDPDQLGELKLIPGYYS